MLPLLSEMARECQPAFWPQEVSALASERHIIDLTDDQVKWLGGATELFATALDLPVQGADDAGLVEAAQEVLGIDDRDFYAHIGGRLWRRRLPSSQFANASFVRAMLRVPHLARSILFNDALQNDYPVCLELLPHEVVPKWREFRAFIKGRRIGGVSQLHTGEVYPEIHQQEQAIRAAMSQFFRDLVAVTHLDDLVVDLVLQPSDSGFRAELTHISPFEVGTDACLFNWRKPGEFDGAFRYHKGPRTPPPGGAGGPGSTPHPETDYWIVS